MQRSRPVKIGCKVDSQFSHLAWTQMPRKEGGLGEIRYPLLSDISKTIARDYCVLLDGGIAARGVFIMDKKGILQSHTVNNRALATTPRTYTVCCAPHREMTHEDKRGPQRCAGL